MFVNESTKAQAQALLDYWDLANHHEQMHWVSSPNPVLTVESFDGVEVDVCGTNACAAGTVVFLNSTLKEFKYFAKNFDGNPFFWMEKAGPLLGLETYDEQYRLFYANTSSAKRLVKALAEGDQHKFFTIYRVQV